MSRNNSDNNLAENYILVNAENKDQPLSTNGSSIAPSDLEIISSFSGTSSSASSTSASIPTQLPWDIPRTMDPSDNQHSNAQSVTSRLDDHLMSQEISNISRGSNVPGCDKPVHQLQTTIVEVAKVETSQNSSTEVSAIKSTTSNLSHAQKAKISSILNSDLTSLVDTANKSKTEHSDCSQQQQAVVSPESSSTATTGHQQTESTQQKGTSAALMRVKISDDLNIFDWFKSTGIMNQIAEKAKNSVDSVITVLDPGMKEYLSSGGSVNIIVISQNEAMVAPVREAFQEVFGRATVNGVSLPAVKGDEIQQPPKRVANGLEQAVTMSLENIKSIRADTNKVPQNQVILNIEPTLTNCISQDFPGLVHDRSNIGLKSDENGQLSKWFYAYNMILDDPVLGTFMNSFSQPVPVDMDCVNKIKIASIKNSEQGENTDESNKIYFSGTVDEIMINRLNLTETDDWIEEWTGISNHLIIYNLSKCMAHLYKRKWQKYTENNN